VAWLISQSERKLLLLTLLCTLGAVGSFTGAAACSKWLIVAGLVTLAGETICAYAMLRHE
jgi:hypothetical protein